MWKPCSFGTFILGWRRTRAWTGEWTGWKTPAGEYFGVRKLSENHSAPELEIATEWFRELNNRVPKPH